MVSATLTHSEAWGMKSPAVKCCQCKSEVGNYLSNDLCFFFSLLLQRFSCHLALKQNIFPGVTFWAALAPSPLPWPCVCVCWGRWDVRIPLVPCRALKHSLRVWVWGSCPLTSHSEPSQVPVSNTTLHCRTSQYLDSQPFCSVSAYTQTKE